MRVYELSAQNRVLSVSDNWDRFARGNGGEGALSQVVMGRPIWDFVAGLETRSYLNALTFAARSACAKVAVRYRSDSVAERRVYQLQIEPLEGDGVRLVHLPLDIARHIVRAPRSEDLAEMSCCSQCLRWRRGAGWEETDLFHGLARGAVDYLICPRCRAEAQRAIEHALSARKVH